jgi:hypothetical protein
MISEARHQGATIIPFPNAAERRAKRFEEEARRILDTPYEVVSEYEGGWYHSDAIRDAVNIPKQ